MRNEQEIIDEFIANLERLNKSDRGATARLKRCAGRPLEECTSVFPLFYRLIPPEVRGHDRQEHAYMLVASLFPMSPGGYTGDIGQSLRALANRSKQGEGGVDRRMAVLLDCDGDDLPFRLRQTVRLLSSQDIGIDWRQLLQHVLRWDAPWRSTQKRWARSYFGMKADNDETDAGSTAASGSVEE